MTEPNAGEAAQHLRLLADPQLARAIQVVATLGIADSIVDGPRPVHELALGASCDPDALHRMLRYLAFAGVFEATADRRYGLTPMGRLLRSDEPGSLRAQLSIRADNRALWWSTGELLHSVRTGQPAYDHVYGESLWETLRARPGSSTRFHAGMAECSDEIVDGLLRAYDWARVGTVADVGGGAGTVLARLLGKSPTMHGMLVDLPAVASTAEETIAEAGLTDRCAVVSGDFLENVPPGADCYILMRVLHDWPDDTAVTILRNCAEACGRTGRLLIVDMEVGAHDRDGQSYASDIMMLLLVGGRERGQHEFAGLLGSAGLAITERIELSAPYVAIEARPT